jgi:lipopolysaccharide export system ATP-binding protein
VLITDHNVRDTLKLVDRAYILHNGRVIVSGFPEEIINNDNVQRVYLGKDFNIV